MGTDRRSVAHTMIAHEPVTHVTDCDRAMDFADDQSLLKAIAQQRDEAAFAELYERYQNRAFNLALRIVRNHALAQDAVQEAMLSIWAAKSALPTGDTEDWIMKIVANKSINLASSRKRSANRVERMAVEQNRSQVAVSDEAESSELIAMLRNCIDQLPELECKLLACCYGANMSHRKIAETVGMPQRTVTDKIHAALERLRGHLTKAGVVAVVPSISAEILCKAMTTGHECPPGMLEMMKTRIKGYQQSSLSQRAVAAGRGSWIPYTAGLVVVAAVAGAFGWPALKQGFKPAGNDAAANAPLPDAALPASRTWNFNAPEQAGEIKVVEGSWHWISGGGPDGSGCMELQSGKFICLLDVTKLPALITYRSNIVGAARQSDAIGVQWEKHQGAAYFQNLGREAFVPPMQWTTVRIYATERSLDCWINDERFQLCAVSLVPGSRLRLAFSGQRKIDDLTVQAIAPGEVKDATEYLSAVEKIAPAQRQGAVVLPGLKGTVREKPVSVEFVPMPLEVPKN